MSPVKKSPSKKSPKKSSKRQAIRKRTLTPEDLLRIHFVASPQISPDGQQIVFVHKQIGKKNEYLTNLSMVTTDGDQPAKSFTSSGKDRSPAWSPCGNRIAFVSSRDDKKPQIYLIDSNGGEAVVLSQFPQGSVGQFQWSPDGQMIAVSFRPTAAEWTQESCAERKEKGLSDPPRVNDDMWYRLDGDGYFDKQRYALYLIDVSTGKHRAIYTKDTLGSFGFDFSPDSKKLLIATNRDRKAMLKPHKDELVICDVKTGKLRPVPNLPEGPKSSAVWSPDGKTIAYAGRIGTDGSYSTNNLELFVCDPVKGNARSLTSKTDYCLLAVGISDTAEAAFSPTFRWAPNSKRLYVKLGWHGQAHIATIERRGGPVRLLTTGNVEYDMGNISSDGKAIALIKGTTIELPEVGVGEIQQDKIGHQPLTALNKSLLKELALSKPTSHWVTTADGTKVQVWAMMPANYKKGSRNRYPAVLEIHGGPHAQYGVGFFHELQTLAAAGYAVFYANPRGSKGYGQDHCSAIRGKWGTADWVDMQAVTDFMQNHPNVNAKRMGVMGGSYGGYMTNWTISHCHDFKAAITDRCVSNLVSFEGNTDWLSLPDDYFPGNFWAKPEKLWEQSPIHYFGNVKTPTLIIHSEGDLRCNIEQGEQVYACLKLRNVPAKMVRYPRSTSHGLSRMGPPDLRLHRLHEILKWWSHYLK